MEIPSGWCGCMCNFLLERLLKTFLTLGDVIAGRVFSLMDRQTLSLSQINVTFSRCLFFASWEPVIIYRPFIEPLYTLLVTIYVK